jgi:hypothetical protein
VIYETLTISLRASSLEPLETAIRKVADEEWDEQAQMELYNLANDLRSRLQRIQIGDIQKQ